MAQPVQCCKQEGLSLNPWHPHQKLGEDLAYNSRAGEQNRGISVAH